METRGHTPLYLPEQHCFVSKKIYTDTVFYILECLNYLNSLFV